MYGGGNGPESVTLDCSDDSDQVVSVEQETLTVPDIASKEKLYTTREACRTIRGKRAKEENIKKNVMMKKLKLAEHCLAKTKRHNIAVNRHNNIFLYIDGPGGAESEKAKKHICLLQGKDLTRLRDRLTARSASVSEKAKEDDFPEPSTCP